MESDLSPAIIVRHYGRLDEFQEDANALYVQRYKPILVSTVTAGPLKSAPFSSRTGKELGLGKQRLIVVYERA
jgi:hypothetical protein